jgi:protein TonB
MSSEGGGVRNDNIERPQIQSALDALPGNTLQGCLIGADQEQAKRQGWVRRRALVVSTLLQSAAVLVVVAIPFFGKVERIASANFVPIPPYHPYSGGAHAHPMPAGPQTGNRTTFCLLCRAAHPQPRQSDGNGRSASGNDSPEGAEGIGVAGGEPCITGCIIIGRSEGPQPPPLPPPPNVVHMTHIDPALLLERVEPIYPALPKQIHREGRVELHAIISTDGTIESLEVVSGDALFYQSALDAVRRWRYRPTRVNGQVVRVDTYITVIYTMRS